LYIILGNLTIGLYEELSGTRLLSKESQDTNEENAIFDPKSISLLNEIAQKEKKKIEYIFLNEGGSAHRKEFRCEILINREKLGTGEGVSKTVAKAKAANIALRQFKLIEKNENENKNKVLPLEDEDALQSDKRIFVLGIDMDEELIKRANKKKSILENNSIVTSNQLDFYAFDIMSKSKLSSTIHQFLSKSDRDLSNGRREFDLITCFSVTMWIHLNHGDNGLWQFLGMIADMTDHLIVEPQPWRCYRNAYKRLQRMGIQVPKRFKEIQVRQNVLDQIRHFLLTPERFKYKCELGKTNWSRTITLYSRTKIPRIQYDIAE
jgi:hypothetical protein